MGMIDNLRNLFKSSKKEEIENSRRQREEEEYRKSKLASQIVDLVDQIKRINSFDSCVWNLSNTSTNELRRKSLPELEKLKQSLLSRHEQLVQQSKRRNPTMEALEASKWTGQKPEHLTDAEFDRWQRDER